MIKPDDIFFYFGGQAAKQTGVPLWRQRPRYKGGEDLDDTSIGPANSYGRQRTTGTYVLQAPGGANNSPRLEWWDLDGDDARETAVFIVEQARTNVALQSSNLADSSSPWAGNGDFTIASATSIIDGQTAYRHTNDGVSAARTRSDTVGTCTGSAESIWCILEQDTANEAVTSAVDFASDGNLVSRATLTWATGAVAVTDDEGAGTVHRVKLADVGPNGGAVYLFGVTASGTAAEARTLELYPTGIDQNTKGVYVHHVQHEEAAFGSLTPIPTAGSSVARSADDVELPWFGPMDTFQVYTKFIEYGGINTASAIVYSVGTTSNGRLILRTHSSGGEYQAVLGNASTTTSTGTGGSTPTYGDEVEYLLTVNADGSIAGTQVINATADTTLTGSAITPASSWSAQTLYLGQDSANANVGGHGQIALIATRGTSYTLAEYRELSEA